MKHIILFILLTINLSAAQKVFLNNAASKIIPNGDYLYKLACGTGCQGASVQTCVTNTIVGDILNQYWPSTTAGHIITKTAAGTKTIWISAPLSAAFTIAATITPNVRGLESATAANAGFQYQVMRWSVRSGGIVSSLGKSADDSASEWTTSETAKTAPTIDPTDTAFIIGDRVVIIIYNDDGTGVVESASSRTWTLFYDGATGATGDTFFTFTENLTFSADSNNAPSRPAFLWFLIEPAAYAVQFFERFLA